MDIKEIMTESYRNATEKGFWNHSTNEFATQIALIHSEVTEALTACRNKEGDDHIAEEMADIILRTANVCFHYGLDLESAIARKMAYNKTRPYMHGDKLFG